MTMLLNPPVVVPATVSSSADAWPADLPLYRLSVEQYHEMIRHAILNDREPVELLDGLLVRKIPEDPVHAAVTDLTADAFRQLLPAGWIVRPAHPITLVESEPEPDVVIARGTQRDYVRHHPIPADCALTAEVANTSIGRDRGVKRHLYAAADVAAYWIILVSERAVEVHTDPSGPSAEPAYATVRRHADGERVPVVVDGRAVGTVAVADLLP